MRRIPCTAKTLIANGCWLSARLLLVAGLLLIADGWLLVASCAWAEVPSLIRYQGTLADAQAVPLEGPYTCTFRLYDAATGGTPVWQETQTNVPLAHGQFSVLLGQVTPLTLAFDRDLWLSVEVNGDGEMSPRQRLTSVPYALRAKVAENTKTSAIEDDGHAFVPTGGIILWTGASCPTGYARISEFDGKHLVGGSTPGLNQGSDAADLSHTHEAGSYVGPAHTHAFTTGAANGGTYNPEQNILAQPVSRATHMHSGVTNSDGSAPVTGASAVSGATQFDNRPAGRTILLCQKE